MVIETIPVSRMTKFTPQECEVVFRRPTAHSKDLAAYLGRPEREIRDLRSALGCLRSFNGERIGKADIYRITNIQTGEVILEAALKADCIKAMHTTAKSFNTLMECGGTSEKWKVEEVSWELAERSDPR